MKLDDISPWVPRALILFGISFMLTAGIDLFTTVWPLRPSDIAWRYGFLGLGAGYLQTPTLGLVLIVLAGAWTGNAALLRGSGIFALGIALLLLLAMGMFGLDVLQMREIRAEDARASVLAGGAFQELKYFVATIVFALLGVGALGTAKAVGSGARGAGTPGIIRPGS